MYGVIITWMSNGKPAFVKSNMRFEDEKEAQSYVDMFNRYAGNEYRKAKVVRIYS